MAWPKMAAAIVILLLAAAAAGLVIANSRGAPGVGALASPTASAPTSPCSTTDTAAFKRRVADLLRRFDDAERLARSSARIALPTVVTQLQALRREAMQLEPQNDCTRQAILSISVGMDATVDGYLSFMRSEPEAVQRVHFDAARAEFDKAGQELAKIP